MNRTFHLTGNKELLSGVFEDYTKAGCEMMPLVDLDDGRAQLTFQASDDNCPNGYREWEIEFIEWCKKYDIEFLVARDGLQ